MPANIIIGDLTSAADFTPRELFLASLHGSRYVGNFIMNLTAIQRYIAMIAKINMIGLYVVRWMDEGA